jgi:hypothetical protein
LLQDFGSDENDKVRVVGSTVPVVSNVTTVHNFSIDIGKISIWYFLILGEIVVEHITANG